MYVRSIMLAIGLAVITACGAPPVSQGPASAPSTGTRASGTATASTGTSKAYRVGIVQQTSHPALDAAVKGVKDAFIKSGLSVVVEEKNAQNDATLLTTIADGFRDAKVDIVVAVGTKPLQSAFKSLQGSGIPIVFNAVTDPYANGAGVATSETEHPGVTGIQALPPVRDAFDMITKIKPGVKKVGIIWTSNEANSKVATGLARDYAKTLGIQFVEAQVTKADEVLSAAENLVAQKVDAIFISTDTTVVSALDSVVKVANESKIGLFCNDPASARRGCTTGLGLDYYDNGFSSATDMAVPILKGTSVDSIPIRKQQKQILAINTAAAVLQGLTIPQAILDTAATKIDTITAK
ncbi:MAG: ABC transporter substrate-binding protein [Herpetosiphon sp.]